MGYGLVPHQSFADPSYKRQLDQQGEPSVKVFTLQLTRESNRGFGVAHIV